MRYVWLYVGLSLASQSMHAQDAANEAWQLERSGDAAKAREGLQRAAEAGGSPANLRAYAEFLERHRDPGARAAYTKLLQALDAGNASSAEKSAVARRLLILDTLAGDREGAGRHLAAFSAAGGTGLSLPQTPGSPRQTAYIEIPGPLRSFARMSALSPDLNPEDFLPALARNVVTTGYQAVNASEGLEPTEYLKLVVRYLSQARELEKIAGPEKVIKIEACESAIAGDLLKVIGYRMRGSCGADVILETVNASRAFLTIDSGFPVAELEAALRLNRPFTLDYHPARLPLMYTLEYWQSAKDKTQGDFIDYFLSDPALCRLYLGLSKLDPQTADEMRKQMTAPRLKIWAHVLDFFGAMFEIREGKAIVPGGTRSEKAWEDLAGASPEKGAAFFEKLMAKDDGWLASYFDSLARINGPVKDYLAEPDRLKRFYTAIRGRVTSPGPARPVFRSNTDMLLLTTRLRIDPNGKLHLPGSLDSWKSLFVDHPTGKYDAKLTRAAPAWKDPDDVLEALFGLSRKAVENEPLKIFMALSDVDRNRPASLAPATVDRLIRDYHTMRSQYSIFSEAPMLTDKTILAYLDTARGISLAKDFGIKQDAAGTLQALVGLWQIFVRQGSIAAADADATLSQVLSPFAKVQNEREIFDGGESGLRLLLKATHSPEKGSAQDRIIDLLAGTGDTAVSDSHDHMVEDMIRIFEAQRLVSIDTLLELGDNLNNVSKGEKLNTALAAKLAARISEVQLPRSALTTQERNSLSYGYWTERHIDGQRKLNLKTAIEKAANDPQKLKDLRGQLAPFLRDTLVGFDYMHYAPPGAQVLHTNPLFVRSHDFIGVPSQEQTWRPTQVFGSGWPSNAGGRLEGSLASLPYALAEAEQNFLVPSREQALIWGDLVPQMILTAVIPRWWSVSPLQLHYVGIHMAYGESLLAESALNPQRRTQVEAVLNRYAPPVRVSKVDQLLLDGDVRNAIDNVVPAEMYLLAEDLAANDTQSPLAAEIRRLGTENADAVSQRTISRTFGTPKPTLATSFQPELLNLRSFPSLMGYSSRILAESWESNLLYFAALADETYVSPAELNVLIPTWTRQTVEQIFATHLEDWPALLRSLRSVGDGVRDKARKQAQEVAAN